MPNRKHQNHPSSKDQFHGVIEKLRKRLVILSGPASVGKGPLVAALNQFHSAIRYSEIPVIKSKESRGGIPRPDELDKWEDPAYFRTADEIKKLAADRRFVVGDCRGLPQAVDLEKVKQAAENIILIEIYHTLGRQLRASTYLESVNVTTVFLSPISKDDIALVRACGLCPVAYVKGLIAHKQIARAQFQRKRLDRPLIADIAARAEDAIGDLRSAPDYSCVIVNHDGEGSENWNRSPKGDFLDTPRGDAKATLDKLASILVGTEPADVEHWSHGTI